MRSHSLVVALELWIGPREKQCQSIVLSLCRTGALGVVRAGAQGLLGGAVAVPDVPNRRGDGRARPPEGSSSAGRWPGRSEASSANTDYKQMSQALLSVLWLCRERPLRGRGRAVLRGDTSAGL